MVLAIVPGNLEVAQVPQMITLSFNGAVNVDNIPIYQELFAEGKTMPYGGRGTRYNLMKWQISS